ncbi:hypothetical protein EYZ11_010872 [Aspergillus tanneri]|uniref:WW domain-containing protein n=1 Tax=Aspergillus tanneri TaxID=1220188 RepID=A0A4S3J4J3_9EURO|nr:uncharacterized protein ATNIH1004_006244 [Aspergillus tanneri]KAA8647550.1 hypothetical protein ATNIH1004_006244 [Aspergillus tanneri]THC89675.1 hypothetical protein EYZ11_010872 [Aspergillus tanneri]
MSFAPPPGPPPPSVPDGWKAQFDNRYREWFFVNLRTGKSQWERPEVTTTEELHGPPSDRPPSYEDSAHANSPVVAATAAGEKKALGSNNPYNIADPGTSTLDSDARLAAQLQEEEAWAHTKSSRSHEPGTAADYYTGAAQAQSTSYGSSLVPPPQSTGPEQKQRSKGFLNKLMGKSSSRTAVGYGRPPPLPSQQQQQQPYPYPQGGYYGGYPPQPVGYSSPAYPAQGGFYSAAAPQQRRHGLGTAGAAALGVGGGLLGGALLAEAFDDHHDYVEYNDYGDGDFGGGDFGDF